MAERHEVQKVTDMNWMLLILLLMIGSPAGAIMFADDMPEYTEYDEFHNYRPTRIVIDHENRKWFMSPYVVFMYDDFEWIRFWAGKDIPGMFNDIQVDRQGDIWLATDGGIAKWNGVGWAVFNQDNTGMTSNKIEFIRFGPADQLWLLTDTSIDCYDGDVWENITFSGRKESNTDFEVDGANTVWLNNGGSVSRYDSTGWQEVKIHDDIHENVSSIIKRPDNVILLTIDDEVWAYEDSEWVLEYTIPYGTPLFCDDQDRLWVTGLNCCKGDTYAEIRLDVQDGMIDRDGYFWGVGQGRAYSFTPKFLDLNEPGNAWSGSSYSVDYYPGEEISITWLADGIERIDIAWSDTRSAWQPIAKDVDPSLCRFNWRIPSDIIHQGMFQKYLKFGIFSTGPDGYADSTKITLVIEDFSTRVTLFPNIPTGSLCEDDAGNLWFTDNSGSLVKIDGNGFTSYHPDGDIILERLTIAPDGCFWMTYRGEDETGVIKFDGNDFIKWPFDVGRTSICGLTVSPHGYVWCAMFGPRPEGYMGYVQLYRFDGIEWVQMNGEVGYSMYHYSAMESAPDGSIWLSSDHGLWVLEHDTWRFTGDIPEADLIFWDKNNDMWVTKDNTLYQRNGDEWIAYPVDIPLHAYEHIIMNNNVAIDNKNQFWFQNFYGPVMFDHDSWHSFDCDFPRIDVLFFDQNDAMWFGFNARLTRFGDTPVQVSVESTPVPMPFSLDAPYPNPFNLSVTIPFSLPEAAQVEIAIYSITGQRVRELRTDWLPAGSHALRWDGRDDTGAVISSGLYIIRAVVGGHIATRKVVLVK